MPTYDYKCEQCGHVFEKFQPITAKRIRICPKCKQRTLKRLIGMGSGVIFKGSGFYQTDYRSASYRKDAEKDKPTTDKGSDEKTSSKAEESPKSTAKDET